MYTALSLLIVAAFSVILPSQAFGQSGGLATAREQGAQYYQSGDFERAIDAFQEALKLTEKAVGPDHPDVAEHLYYVAEGYRALGQFTEAEPLYLRALRIVERAFGPNHQLLASSSFFLATAYINAGRFADAEPLYRRSIEIYERVLGSDNPTTVQAVISLAEAYLLATARFAEVESLCRRAIQALERTLGPNDPSLVPALNDLALSYTYRGRFAEAEPLLLRARNILESAVGLNDLSLIPTLSNLGGTYQHTGRFADAEQLYRRVVDISERALGSDHPRVAHSIGSLAELYREVDRFDEAEPLLLRAIEILEHAPGPDGRALGANLNNLGEIYRGLGRFADAEPLYRRSLEIDERVVGPDHPVVAASLNNLGGLLRATGRFAEAEPALRRALEINQGALGLDHREVAMSEVNLAVLYSAMGRFAEAEPLYQSAMKTVERVLGPDHPDVAILGLTPLAEFYEMTGRLAEAEPIASRASELMTKRAMVLAEHATAHPSHERSRRDVLLTFLSVLDGLVEKQPLAERDRLNKAFEVAQAALTSSAGAAISRMGARIASGQYELAEVIRQRQDAVNQWRALDAALVQALSRPAEHRDRGGEYGLRAQRDDIGERIAERDAAVAQGFPQYAELESPRPVPLSEVQSLLSEDEALLFWVTADDWTMLFAVRSDHVLMQRLKIGSEALAEMITQLRDGVKLQVARIEKPQDVPSFDVKTAHDLYSLLLAPAAAFLDEVEHVFVVPDGALQSLPIGVLVSSEPKQTPLRFADYRDVAWVARTYALTTLPTVSSLKSLRRHASVSQGKKPFLGIGAPDLRGDPINGGMRRFDTLYTLRGLADTDSVRTLEPLPDTAKELRALAAMFGAALDDVWLGERAREKAVKNAQLADYRTLAFATHALVAGSLNGLAEPALVLTPPSPSLVDDMDDGLLSMSEIAQLELDADWVILSACNTAAPNGRPGAEGLSGLAQAFFYAGSRALLVSHWPVVSDAAIRLTTEMLSELTTEPGMSKAEALRRATLSVMEDDSVPFALYAHPMFWAPFIVVGG